VSWPRLRGAKRAASLAGALLIAGILGGCGSGGPEGEDTLAASPGAPFSFDVPKGFELVEGSFPGGGAKFLTTLVPAGTEHEGTISAFQWQLSPTQRLYSTRRLLGWIERQTQTFYRGAGAELTHGMSSEVGGHEAICWMIHGFDNAYDGRVDADACAIVAGHEVIQQACTWKRGMRARIERGCAEARGSFRLS
jgi:hypothetical protein